MIQEVVHDTADSDTLPLWALQPLTRQAPPRECQPEQSPFEEAPARRPVMSRPPTRQHAEDRFLNGLVVLFALLNVADLTTTFIGLHSGMHEGNPLMSALLSKYGFLALIVYKVAVVAAVARGVRMLRSFRVSVANVTIAVCNLLVLFVVIANIAQYFLKA